ncbi:kinase-like domain-containing protein [Mycena amicta]|nr:kinase-like domain-containing protein [Mycena amicta]
MHSSSTEKLATYINSVPSIFKALAHGHNTKLLCLELVINRDAYGEREELDAVERNLTEESSNTSMSSPNSSSTSWKRERATSASGAGALNKCLRALSNTNIDSTLGSRFGLSGGRTPNLLQPKTQSRVTLERFDVSVDPTTYDPELFRHAGQIEAIIQDTHFAKGGSKLAYDMSIFADSGKEERAVANVVAKRIYRTSDDDSHSLSNGVTLTENRALLEAECHRLALGTLLFASYVSYCKEMEVVIFNFVEFASVYLATEKAIQVTRSPSVASGLDGFNGSEDGITWMIKAKRAAAVIKFTSTLNHKARGSDLQTLTIHSFAHYVFGATHGSLVMADLQGTPATVRGNDGLVLFDVMTHTQDGSSGLGDFGLEGIESFINTHECNQLCKRLDFEEVFPLELPIDIPGPDTTEGSEGGAGHADDSEED